MISLQLNRASVLSMYDCSSLKALELIGQVRLCLKKRTGRLSDSASASFSSGMLLVSTKRSDKSHSLLIEVRNIVTTVVLLAQVT